VRIHLEAIIVLHSSRFGLVKLYRNVTICAAICKELVHPKWGWVQNINSIVTMEDGITTLYSRKWAPIITI
jgi:hypothetical protein